MSAIDRIIVSSGALLLAFPVGVSPSHADRTVITRPSRYSVSETIDWIGKAVTDKGMTLFARIHHAEEARKA
jgi:hypothetical protein